MDTSIFEKVDAYISDLLAQEDEILKAVIRSMQEENIPFISISANQGKMLQVFAAICHAKNILELGTLAGYSTIWLARALPENGKLITIEYDPHHSTVAKRNIEDAGLGQLVEIRTGKALDILAELDIEKLPPFDLVFIDADKPPYLEYFQWAIKHSRPGSIIIADNVVRNGEILDPNSPDEKVQGVQRLNKFLADFELVSSIIIPSLGAKEYDGMAIAVVKYKKINLCRLY